MVIFKATELASSSAIRRMSDVLPFFDKSYVLPSLRRIPRRFFMHETLFGLWCKQASGGYTTLQSFANTSVAVVLQVCALQWNRHQKELLSSHGFSQNQLSLWKYPSMVKIAELTGHTARVLHLSQVPSLTINGFDLLVRFSST